MAAKILLVEDDTTLSEIYQARLQAESYEVLSAADGENALAIAVKEHPDLIISDVMMPKISGFDMLDILRTTDGIKDTKVIMMTALSQDEDKARADKLGADRYLVKSQVTLEDVIKVIQEVLSGQTASPPIIITQIEEPTPLPTSAAAIAVPPPPAAMPVAVTPITPAPIPTATAQSVPQPTPTPIMSESAAEALVTAPAPTVAALTPAAQTTNTTLTAPAAVALQPQPAPQPAPHQPIPTPIMAEPASVVESSVETETTQDEETDVMKQIQAFVDEQGADQGSDDSPISQPPPTTLDSTPTETQNPQAMATPPVEPETSLPISAAEPDKAEPDKPKSEQVPVAHKKVIEPPKDSWPKNNLSELAASAEASQKASDVTLDNSMPHQPGSTIQPTAGSEISPSPSSISL